VLQSGVAEEVEVRHAPRRRDAGEETAVGRGRGRRVQLLRPEPERVVPVHRSLRPGAAGTDDDNDDDGGGGGGVRETAQGLQRASGAGQGPVGLSPGQLGSGHADGRRLRGHD